MYLRTVYSAQFRVFTSAIQSSQFKQPGIFDSVTQRRLLIRFLFFRFARERPEPGELIAGWDFPECGKQSDLARDVRRWIFNYAESTKDGFGVNALVNERIPRFRFFIYVSKLRRSNYITVLSARIWNNPCTQSALFLLQIKNVKPTAIDHGHTSCFKTTYYNISPRNFILTRLLGVYRKHNLFFIICFFNL